jgi:4-hydroxy-2-oxoheptanedioate aldolase
MMMSEIRAILRNSMKEKLASDEVVASMTVRFARSMEIAQIAKTAGHCWRSRLLVRSWR